jgi:hypothetical protein
VKELLEVIRTAANVPPAKEKEFNNDKDNFEKYLAHIGDTRFLQETVLQNSFDNYFLSRLRDGVANVDFTNAIDKKANRLQDLSDIEQRKVLKAVADYDPDRFLGQLKTLRDALNKK